MTFVHQIPLAEIRAGDHFDAEIPVLKDGRGIWRRCTVVDIHGSIIRVKTATRKGLVAITRDKIRSEHAWGER